MKRGKFSLSNYKLFTCDMGELIPCAITEVLPGDTVQQSTSALIRCAPMLAPVMHPVQVRIHHWYVPFRILWDKWEDFITGGSDGLDASVFPVIDTGAGNFALGSLGDYLGIPPAVNGIVCSALPFRAYALIWNEFYRDQDLETPLVISQASGADTTTSRALKNCAWEKDYFTSSRPWEQKGPAVTIPLGTTAPIQGTGYVSGLGIIGNTVNASASGVKESFQAGGTVTYGESASLFGSTNSADPRMRTTTGVGGLHWPDVTLQGSYFTANLANASAITVNLLREALALQRYEEARARYGSRYVEYLRYLGVRSSDARLQRPEYLGGGRQTIQFSEVLQTAQDGTNPVGTLRGHGITAVRSNRYRRFFEEHGYVLSLMSVKPKTMYAQGQARHWNRRTKDDFWQKEFQHIGQQEILNKEIYAAHATPLGTFGFQDRYDEYRRSESSIAGEFRNSTLDYWHMARIFGSTPALNSSFVSSVPTKRNFASQSTDVLYVMANHSIQARRLVAQVGKSFIF